MSDTALIEEKEQKRYELISYQEEVEFKYTLADEDEPRSIERELTFIWEDSIEKFIEEHGSDKPYKINSYKRETEYRFFVDQIEGRTEDMIEEIEEEIANKMKFGFEFTGQLHNDD